VGTSVLGSRDRVVGTPCVSSIVCRHGARLERGPVASVEKTLGIDDLAQFTPHV